MLRLLPGISSLLISTLPVHSPAIFQIPFQSFSCVGCDSCVGRGAFFVSGDSSCLWCPAGISARSPPLFSLHQTVGGTLSKVLHRLPLFCRWFWALLMTTDGTWVCPENDREYWVDKKTKKKQQTNWSLMSRKLRYFSADRLLGGRVPLLTAFWLAKRPFHSPVLWKLLE